MDLLEVSKLSKHFGGVEAVSNVDLGVQKGEIIGSLGQTAPGRVPSSPP